LTGINNMENIDTLASHTAAIIDPSNNSPIADSPINCPIGATVEESIGIASGDAYWVIQWSFTNSN